MAKVDLIVETVTEQILAASRSGFRSRRSKAHRRHPKLQEIDGSIIAILQIQCQHLHAQAIDCIAQLQLIRGDDVRGFDFAIDRFAPLHIQAEHGDAKAEARRGQRAITESDYGQLPAILNDPDEIRADGDELVVEKQFDSERWVAIFAVLGKRRTLVLKSMRIYKKAPSRSTS